MNPEIPARPFTSTRPDGRFVESAAQAQQRLKRQSPRLAFSPETPPADFSAWKRRVRERLSLLLDFPESPDQPQLLRVTAAQRDGYALEKWELYLDEASALPFLLLVPDSATPDSPRPAVLCFPGSGRTKENLAGEPELPGTRLNRPSGSGQDPLWMPNAMALHYVRAGFVALSVDNPAFGETASGLLDRNALSLSLIWQGWSYEGLAAYQAARLLHALRDDPRVDASRIAASGHSLGAKYADFLGLLYPEKVSAIVHNDFIGDWRERMIALNGEPRPEYQIIPGFFRWFDYTDLQAALAPLPLLCSEGGRTPHLEKIAAAYHLNGEPHALHVFHYEKFASPEARVFDRHPIPEGITMEDYFRFANVDAPNHRFRAERAIPFLSGLWGIPPQSTS